MRKTINMPFGNYLQANISTNNYGAAHEIRVQVGNHEIVDSQFSSRKKLRVHNFAVANWAMHFAYLGRKLDSKTDR